MKEHAVVIAGGGPTGLMLAGELALARAHVVIVERRETQDVEGTRAGGLHARTIEVLDQRGIAERFLSQGKLLRAAPFAHGFVDVGDLPTRHAYVLALRQDRIERILLEWVTELGVPILRGREVTGFAQDASGVDVALSDGQSLRAKYLVGCDGGRSLIRKEAGIDFPGWDPQTSYLIAEAETSEEPAWGFRRDDTGIHGIGKMDDGRARIVLVERRLGRGEATLGDLRDELVAIYGTDWGVRDVSWISRFTDMARQAASYRDRRVLLAGDAAHVHSPVGGQGLNLGVQDAFNLGWKLAQVAHGTSPETLLDTYHRERHPVGARVLRTTMAGTALRRGDERSEALREMLTDLLRADDARRRFTAMMTGLDIRYDLGADHALLGRRMPDLDLIGAPRLFTRMHDAKPILLDFGELGRFDVTPWADRVRRIEARANEAHPSVLIRPDGHVAWVSDGTDRGLRDALTTWFGPPITPSSAT